MAAAYTRAGVADALATITPSFFTPGRCRPPAAMLRTALYGHAFNPALASTDPGPPATAALARASHYCLPLTALADLQVTRRALEALRLEAINNLNYQTSGITGHRPRESPVPLSGYSERHGQPGE